MTHDATSPSPDTEIDTPEPRLRPWATRLSLLLYAFTAIAMGVDVVADMAMDSPPAHVWLETLLMAAALVGVAFFWRQWRADRRLAAASRAALVASRTEARAWQASAERWRAASREALDGLGSAIEAQFAAWKLTPAESEVALLLLKGLALKEAAAVRDVSERTVRQQALAVYRKSGVGGRAELSAFFLEDLLVPQTASQP